MATIEGLAWRTTEYVAAHLTRITGDAELAAQVACYVRDIREKQHVAELQVSELREWKRRSLAARKGARSRKAGA